MSVIARAGRRLRRELLPFDVPVSRGEWLFFRFFEVLVVAWSLWLAWTWAPYIGHIEAVVLPLGVANYVDVSSLFDVAIASTLAVILTVSLGLGLLRRARAGYAVAVVVFHLLYAARYSLGEISHGSHFVGLAVLALALATAMYGPARTPTVRFTLGFLLFFYGLGYTTAAACKLIGTGLHWPAGHHLALWVGERSVDVTSTFGTFELNPLQEGALRSPTLATAALAFGLLAEVGGVLLWFRRTRPLAATALILMHVGVELTLNIWFGLNIYLLALVGYPWGRWLDRWITTPEGFE